MLKYWIWLATRRGLGRRGAWLVANHFSNVQEAYFAQTEAYAEIHGLRANEALSDKDLTEVELILRKCYEKGIQIMTVQDANYPARLKQIDDPPLVLYYKGMVPDWSLLAVGVVGTRKSSAYGALQAREIGYQLSCAGAIVVSGGAGGIDTQAMLGALTGGAPVVGVLGCGVDVVYPANNRKLFEEVVGRGCLLSEYPPETPPRGDHFPVRNRIISGLSNGILVVEAPEKSGALLTANHALEQGRDVFALPASPDTRTCQGNLKLLHDGAIMARNAQDILQEYLYWYPYLSKPLPLPKKEMEPVELWLEDVSASPEPPKQMAKKKPSPQKDIDKGNNSRYIDLEKYTAELSEQEQILAKSLLSGPKHIDTIVEEVQLPTGQVLASLTMLEVKGIVQHLPARMFALAEKSE